MKKNKEIQEETVVQYLSRGGVVTKLPLAESRREASNSTESRRQWGATGGFGVKLDASKLKAFTKWKRDQYKIGDVSRGEEIKDLE